jgi:hypothetical protein
MTSALVIALENARSAFMADPSRANRDALFSAARAYYREVSP